MSQLLALALVLAAMHAQPQNPEPQAQSAKDTLEHYLKIVSEGALLTSEGWNEAGTFFVRPLPLPTSSTIFVTTKHVAITQVSLRGDRAEADEKWVDNLGTVDSMMRYSPPPKKNAEGTINIYRLVFTNKSWKAEGDGKTVEVTGPWAWKIEDPQRVRQAPVDAVVHYVEKVGAETDNPVVKENAAKTIFVLKRYLH